MNAKLSVVLLSSALLIPACSRAPESPTPPAPKNTPAQAQPEGVKAPVAVPAPTPEEIKKTAAPAPTPAPSEKLAPAGLQPASLTAPTIAELPTVLNTIKDAPTAEAAKSKLDTLVTKLEAAKAAIPSGKDAQGVLGKLAGGAAAKLGVSPETVQKIGSLLENPSIKAVIGPTLEKLQGLLK